MVLHQAIDRGSMVTSCVSALAELALIEKNNLTNVSVNKFIIYTRPVPIEGYGVISLVHVVDMLGKASIPEVHIAESEEVFLNAINALRNYTTEVMAADGSSFNDKACIEYAARSGESLSRYISVQTVTPMQIFSAIVLECLTTLTKYFAAVGYDPMTILEGVDRPTTDSIHDGNLYQFLSSEINIIVTMFRVYPNATGVPELDWNFDIGLQLTAMRSGKNDAMFNAIRL